MFVSKRVPGWVSANRSFALFALVTVLGLVTGVGVVVTKQVFAAPPYPYNFIPGIAPDPSVPPPIPNNGSGDASSSVVYPGQKLMFDMTVMNTGTTADAPDEETAKVFMLDPNPGMPYYRAEANCNGSCYDDPGHASYPQPGIVWPNQGYIYTFEGFPPIPPGQVATAPPQSAASAPDYSFAYTIPADATAGRKICFYTHTHPGNPDNLNADGTNNGGYPDTGFGTHCYIIQSLGNGVCDGITMNPAILDSSTSFQVTGRVRYNTASVATYVQNTPGTRFYVTITGPGVNRSYPNVTPMSTSGTSVISATTGLQAPTGQTGVYTVTYGIAGSVGTVNCSTQFTVTKRPYFQVTGGDISAGAGMSFAGNDCASVGSVPAQNAGIVSWNRGAAGNYGGAGAGYGALALNHLQGFATGQGTPYAPSGLAFANVGGGPGQINAGQQVYGGKFGGTNCTADFWENANNVIHGDTWINGQTIPNGTRKTIYVDGKVYITGNITFSGNYATLADVPSFTIISRGNIYVERFVTQLDGFYIAEPTTATGDNGMFKTCAQYAFTPVGLDRNLQSLCDTPLTINGGVVARQVWMNRTAGTLSGAAAETYNYSPEFWVTSPYGNGLNPPVDNGYDSITSLPPVL